MADYFYASGSAFARSAQSHVSVQWKHFATSPAEICQTGTFEIFVSDSKKGGEKRRPELSLAWHRPRQHPLPWEAAVPGELGMGQRLHQELERGEKFSPCCHENRGKPFWGTYV